MLYSIPILFSLVFLLANPWQYQKQADELLVMDLNGNQVQFDSLLASSDTTAVVFYSTYSCADCFTTLAQALDSVAIKHVYILARVNQVWSERSRIERSLETTFPRASFYFESPRPTDTWPPTKLVGGVFGKYHVSKSPCLLLTVRHHSTFYNYDTLFDTVQTPPLSETHKLLERIMRYMLPRKS